MTTYDIFVKIEDASGWQYWMFVGKQDGKGATEAIDEYLSHGYSVGEHNTPRKIVAYRIDEESGTQSDLAPVLTAKYRRATP